MSKKKNHSPRTIRINEELSKGRCQKCNKVSSVHYFCEKNLLYNRKVVEIILCSKCLNDLIFEISEGNDIKQKVFLPILKFMRGDRDEVTVPLPMVHSVEVAEPVNDELQNKVDINLF
jgi:hypothetical protein